MTFRQYLRTLPDWVAWVGFLSLVILPTGRRTSINNLSIVKAPNMYQTLLRAVLPLIAFIALTVTAHAKQPVRTIEGAVTKVSDGDTIQVTDSLGTKVKVRMYGMDAPETTKMNRKTGVVSKPGQRFGEEAFKALEGKLKRQRVRLDVMDVDRYGRTVSIVWLGDRNINKEMVADGWAWAYRQYLDRAHASEYIKAEEQARAKGLGLWEEHNPQPPWEFRKMLKRSN